MATKNSKLGSSADPESQRGHHDRVTIERSRSLPLSSFSVGNLCKKFLMFVFVLMTLIAYCAVVPLFALFMAPIYAYRGIVILLQRLIHPEWVGIMSSRDAVVGLDDTTKKCECMIVASVVFRGVPDVRKIQAYFQQNVMEARNSLGELWYEKMTHYYENWLGFPFWKKEKNFCLEKHLRLFDRNIKVKKVPGRNGELEDFVTEDELLRCLGEIEKVPFEKGQSPWEILILPNFIPRQGDLHKPYIIPQLMITTTEGEVNGNEVLKSSKEDKYFTLVYRVHHAIGDGYSFLKMLMCNICGETLDCVPKAPTREYHLGAKILNTIALIVFTPYYHFKQFFLEIDRGIWHLSARKLSRQSHFVTTEMIPMESLKQVGRAYKVPLTGVLLAGLAGGIHNFLKLTGKGHLTPKFMRALSPMPWRNHPAFNGQGMVNHWTAGIFAIAAGGATPQKRLKESKRSMDELINSPILITNFLTIPLLLSAPNFLTDIWGTNWMASMILSNFPGPKLPTYSFGCYPLDHIITFVPHMRGSAGLGVMFPTSLGNARCTVSIDTSILKDYSDAQLLVGLIDEEFRILRTLRPPNAENHV